MRSRRYTGVLYDPLGAQDADAATREWWAEHVIVQSAMFGPIGCGDPIPAYRLSHDSRLASIRLAAHWPAVSTRSLLTRADGLVLDLRSEGYRQLGPVPGAVAPRVVSVDGSGRRRALNHWNKTAKGRLVALLARTGASIGSMGDLVDWAAAHGVVVETERGRLGPGRREPGARHGLSRTRPVRPPQASSAALRSTDGRGAPAWRPAARFDDVHDPSHGTVRPRFRSPLPSRDRRCGHPPPPRRPRWSRPVVPTCRRPLRRPW
ncbi:peroxide stress protein YaaA [Curtobacterium flaccumfaciens]|nr:peroxide stress protein YaaA [Curtobacterium flaccumfaciens]